MVHSSFQLTHSLQTCNASIHSFPELFLGLIHPINYSNFILSRTIKKFVCGFETVGLNSLIPHSKHRKTNLRTFQLNSQNTFRKEIRGMNMEVQKVLKHHFKNGLGREPTLETLTLSTWPSQKTIQRHFSQNYEKNETILSKMTEISNLRQWKLMADEGQPVTLHNEGLQITHH